MKRAGDLAILVVDDDEDLREIIAFEFTRAGCKVLLAATAAEALAHAKSVKIDAIVSDFLMPTADGTGNENGLALINQIQALGASSPTRDPVVILLTGFGDLLPPDAYSTGTTAVFAKPVDRKALLAYVLEKLGAGSAD
ncbi:MAG: response regulator [Deltaproteobacteria bacterium]|nr:response regulator [Deltaproteobacteria bacterium]